ncbi:MAG: tripartite tricarboxylate transporter substrate binding protein [Burkholderiales bacterium]
MRHRLAASVLGVLFGAGYGNACAQGAAETAFPAKAVRIVVAFSPGGSLDLLARTTAQRLGDAWKQPVVVDNRPGAGGLTGSEFVAKVAPDGYTLMMAGASNLVNTVLFPKAPDFGRDFTPIQLLVSNPYLLAVHTSLPVRTVGDLVTLARRRPGELTFASSGPGSLPQLAGELFVHMTKTRMVHVPYRGGAPALVDLMAGRADLMFNALPLMFPQVKAGRVRAVAVTTLRRSSALPEVPTIDESGVRGYDVNGWYGLVAPVRTAAAIAQQINRDILQYVLTPEYRERLKGEGSEPVGSTSEQFATLIRNDLAKWRTVVDAARIIAE